MTRRKERQRIKEGGAGGIGSVAAPGIGARRCRRQHPRKGIVVLCFKRDQPLPPQSLGLVGACRPGLGSPSAALTASWACLLPSTWLPQLRSR